MASKYALLRVWKHTAHKLKILAAMQRKSMIAIIEELVNVECKRLQISVDMSEHRDVPKDD